MPSFGSRTTADQVLCGLDLSGKVYLVTGCGSGLGRETMRALASKGAHVIGTARTLTRASEACNSIVGSTTPIACEQSDFESVVRASDSIRKLGVKLDAVVANAGIMAPRTPDVRYGVESQFRVNHLSHMLLIDRVIDLVHDETGRLVIVSSAAQAAAPKNGVDFDNIDASHGYSPWKFYGQSKLANLAYAISMAERLKDRGIISNALHPGMIAATDLNRSLGPFLRLLLPLARLLLKSIPQGAATQCFLAAHPDAAAPTASYFSDCRPAKGHALAQDATFRARLWDVSAAILEREAPLSEENGSFPDHDGRSATSHV